MIKKGLFAVYKPAGITSSEVTQKLKTTLFSQTEDHVHQSAHQRNGKERKRIGEILEGYEPNIFVPDKNYNRRRKKLKIGHGGTLDRFAEGVLVIGIGDDCKRLGSFQTGVSKSYDAVGCLGVLTDTLDPEGTVSEEKEWKHITEDDLRQSLESFRGLITQSPPLYSALKLQGRRYSDYARQAAKTGAPLAIEPPQRQVNILSLSLLHFSPPHFRIMATCSSGTYIRSLVRDIAEKVGTVAYVQHLCRTSQGPFTLEHALREEQNGGWSLEGIRTAIEQATSLGF